MPNAITIDGLVKTLPQERRHVSMLQAVKHALSRGPRFTVLNIPNLKIAKGDRVALLGNNGAGKTTLLRVLAGLLQPTSGQVHVEGSVTLLAGLGVGMVDDLTVTDNLRLYGAIYGIDQATMRASADEIIAWAGLQGFAGFRLKHLSTGMRGRLAFSALRYCDRAVYLLDEVTTAGDKDFSQNCDDVFGQYKERGKTVLAATHDRRVAETFFNMAVWLDHGQVRAYGPSELVVSQYMDGSGDGQSDPSINALSGNAPSGQPG